MNSSGFLSARDLGGSTSFGPSSPLSSSFLEHSSHHKPISSAQHKAEMIRIHQLWQDSKQELREARSESTRLRRQAQTDHSHRDVEFRNLSSSIQGETASLRSELSLKQSQVDNLRKQGLTLSRTCDQITHQLSVSEDKLSAQSKELRQAKQREKELQEKLDASFRALNAKQQVLAQHSAKLETQLRSKNQRIRQVEDQVRSLQDQARMDAVVQREQAAQLGVVEHKAGHLASELQVQQQQSRHQDQALFLAQQLAEDRQQENHQTSSKLDAEIDLNASLRSQIEAKNRKLTWNNNANESMASNGDLARILSTSSRSTRRSPMKSSRSAFASSTAFGSEDVEVAVSPMKSASSRSQALSQAFERMAFGGKDDKAVSKRTTKKRVTKKKAKAKKVKKKVSSGSMTDAELRLIPQEAVILTNQFKIRYMPDVPPAILSAFLEALNAVFQERATECIRRVRVKFQDKLTLVKRKALNGLSYKSVFQDAELKRLRKRLRVEQAKKQNANPEEEALLAQALQTIESLANQVQECEALHNALAERASQAGEVAAVEKQAAFIDGATWISKKARHHVDALARQASSLAANYLAKLRQAQSSSDNGAGSAVKLSAIRDWFLDCIDQKIALCNAAIRKSLTSAGKIAAKSFPNQDLELDFDERESDFRLDSDDEDLFAEDQL